MPLATEFEWANFKAATKIKHRSRGKNMSDVDAALKAYWESVRTAPNMAAQAYSCFSLDEGL